MGPAVYKVSRHFSRYDLRLLGIAQAVKVINSMWGTPADGVVFNRDLPIDLKSTPLSNLMTLK